MAEDGDNSDLAIQISERPSSRFRQLFPTSFTKRFLIALAVCGISGGPSIFIAIGTGFDVAGVCIGGLVFVLLYALVTGTELWIDMWRNAAARRAIVIGFSVRILISIIFPIGGFVDFIIGAFIVAPIGYAAIKAPDFLITLIIALVHGVVLNLIHWGFIQVVYMSVRNSTMADLPDGRCLKCGYDLRASPIRCPECGEPVPNAPTLTTQPA